LLDDVLERTDELRWGLYRHPVVDIALRRLRTFVSATDSRRCGLQ
jgi:hypothetical protein